MSGDSRQFYWHKLIKIKSVALQLRRAKTDWSDCCHMQVQGTLWLTKCYPSTLISVFLTGFCHFSYQVATQLASQGWVDPVPDPILAEKFLGHSQESNPGPLGWQLQILCFHTGLWPKSSNNPQYFWHWRKLIVKPNYCVSFFWGSFFLSSAHFWFIYTTALHSVKVRTELCEQDTMLLNKGSLEGVGLWFICLCVKYVYENLCCIQTTSHRKCS